ncbi:MAG: T9SS type A sorting domain-containing protein [Ferruginibacter sp.]|nr:T9SS type A sorting domain-containing protein [Ferruginibacter sp.]
MKVFTKALFSFCFLFSNYYCQAQPVNWQNRGAGGGGSVFYPSINPANDNEFYIACDMSQLFHSSDYGNTYLQVPFTKLQVGNVSSYEFTSSNMVAYCIANDGNINYGVRSIDGGNTWNALPGNPLSGEDVYALKADYSNPARVVMGYYGTLYTSNDTGKTFSLSWTAANNGAGITIAGIFFDGNSIYIGTNDGVLYSANGGISFSKLITTGMPAAQTIFSFAGAKVGAVTRFFCISANTTDVYNGIFPWEYYGFAKGVYAMDAGTNVWAAKMNGINISNDYMMYAGMARNDINTVYLGGSDATTGGNSVIKTINAGANWNKVFLTANNQNIRTGWSGQNGDRGWGYGESCFGITVAPNNSNKVLFGDFGFVHKTSDGGANWQQAYVSVSDEHPANAATPQKQYYHSVGMENTTSWQVHWQDGNNLFSCFSDINGIRSTDAGLSWGFDYTGHTVNSMYRIAKHATGNTMFAATSGVHDMYQSTRLQDNLLDAADAGGKVIYSATNGATWQLLHQFNHPVFWLATDAGNANRMYASVIHYGNGAGEGGIWMTNDLNNLAASNWLKLANPPRTEGHPAAIVVLNDGKMVCTFSGRRNGTGAFTPSSGVFLYDPGGNSWSDISHADMQYWTKDIVIDPSDPTQNTWYVAVFSGWGGAPNGRGGLFKTTNRGSSWTKLTAAQFDRVTSITFNPGLLNQAYLTTEMQGLWISNNMNAANPTWSLVNSYPFRQPERVFFNPFNINEVWVSSFGNGLKMGLVSGALPVKLISFTGSREKQYSRLNWATTHENSGDVYELERSSDAVNFDKIKTVKSKGDGSNHYFLNDTITGAVLCYRLKIKTMAGSSFYSNTIAFREHNGLDGYVRLMNNPVKENVTMQAVVQKAENLSVTITGLTGKKILQQQVAVSAGINQFNIILPGNFINGIYIVQVQGKQVKENFRVLLVR